jgi:hypothetical protein
MTDEYKRGRAHTHTYAHFFCYTTNVCSNMHISFKYNYRVKKILRNLNANLLVRFYYELTKQNNVSIGFITKQNNPNIYLINQTKKEIQSNEQKECKYTQNLFGKQAYVFMSAMNILLFA